MLAAKAVKAAAPSSKVAGYTVRMLVDEYLAGHIDVNRKPKGAAEVRRLMDKNLGDLAAMQVGNVKRSMAFQFLEGLLKTPVQAASIRSELGAAWNYALDAGRVPEETPKWGARDPARQAAKQGAHDAMGEDRADQARAV